MNMRAPYFVFLLSIFFLLTGCGSKEKTVVVQGESKKISSSGPCPILLPGDLKKGKDVECGTITTTVEKDNVAAGELKVSYFRVFAKNKDKVKSPLVIHFGGPGDDGQGPFQWAASHRDTLAVDRDLIVVGQRGTTHSFVLPDCPTIPAEVDSLESLIASEIKNSELCKKLLDNAGITLSAFSTVSGVRDVEALRIGLGISKLSFYGVSYGTEFALEYVRQFPQAVDRLILDSVIPPNQDMAESHVDEFSEIARYLGHLKVLCEQTPECAAAYSNAVPDFAGSFEAVMGTTQLIQVIRGEPLHPIRILLRGRSAGMSRVRRIQFAAMIQAAANPSGTFTDDGLDTQYSQQLAIWRRLGVGLPSDAEIASQSDGGGGGGFSTGINAFLNCAENGFASSSVNTFISQPRYSFIGRNLRQQIYDLARIREGACSAFRFESELWKQSFSQPVTTGIRTYLFNSTFDSATPLKHAQLAKQSLTDAELFESRCTAHGVILSASASCETAVLREGLDGTLTQASVSCICGE